MLQKYSTRTSGLTLRLYDWTVSSEHLGFYGRPIEQGRPLYFRAVVSTFYLLSFFLT